jgi:hypothetical protein
MTLVEEVTKKQDAYFNAVFLAYLCQLAGCYILLPSRELYDSL